MTKTIYKQDNSKRTRNKGIYLMLTDEEATTFKVMCSQLGITRSEFIMKAINLIREV